MTLVYY